MINKPPNFSDLPEKWQNFLKEIDDSLKKETVLKCIGGFVIRAMYNFTRETSDLDYIDYIPGEESEKLHKLAGKESQLFAKYKMYLDVVTVAQTPDSYEDRLIEIYPNEFQYLKLYALDAYDLAFTKLERSSRVPHDLEDVLYLAQVEGFDLEVFKKRYDEEVRVYMEDKIFHRSTFAHWIAMIEEERGRKIAN